ncbi:MAG: putative molybdenum carrier protein [Cyanobacteria bacterium P01_H01_bin.121]
MNYRPDKIISGGQYGADLAGLDAAQALGIPTGGTAPRGWRVQLPDGSESSNPALVDYGLVEHQSRSYPPRTRANVRDSDGTVWFGYEHSGGGRLTLQTCTHLGKPSIINPTPEQLREWAIAKQIRILNVAGNRASDLNPTIYDCSYTTLVVAFSEATPPAA